MQLCKRLVAGKKNTPLARDWCASVVISILSLAQPAPAACPPEWSGRFGPNGLDGIVYALLSVDESGPDGAALYAGGDFTTAENTPANFIARWDGQRWAVLAGPAGNGLNGAVYALAVFDDGSGPALYAGGEFTTAGGIEAKYVAKWDGAGWSALAGPAGNGTDYWVRALAVYDDGTGPALYAGGHFTTAGGVAAKYAAKWDGAGWSALAGPAGNGTDYWVRALAVHDDGTGPALYVGGAFTTAGGLAANHIARWDGTAWSPLAGPTGNGINGPVWALAAYDAGAGPDLYAGGFFTAAGGVAAGSIARWDGAGWSALSGSGGSGMDGAVSALTVHAGDGPAALYAGGEFTSAGGTAAERVARWDGTDWSALTGPAGNGTNLGVYALTAHEEGGRPVLYAGGQFTLAGGLTANHIAQWDGTAWSAPIGPAGSGVNQKVGALAVVDDGSGPALYAGGDFVSAGATVANYIARWDGRAWSPLAGPAGTGMSGGSSPYVHTLAEFDDGSGPALYAGGWFTAAGGVLANRIAKWDGAQWSPLVGPAGEGMDFSVRALTVYDDGGGPALYAGGEFLKAGGVWVLRIAKWDGKAWSPLTGPAGTGMTDHVWTLAVYDDGHGSALYAGGWFTLAGGTPAERVARWDGKAWSPLVGPAGNGLNLPVRAMAVYDDGRGPALYAGGYFSLAGGIPANRIARWDGTSWSPLVGPEGNGVNGTVTALAVHDDGTGPALYAGGEFTQAGGIAANHIAKWDGERWSALVGAAGNGTNNSVGALTAYDDDGSPALYAGGDFTEAGDLPSLHIARWGCPYQAGDLNCDRSVDAFDIDPFVRALTDPTTYALTYPDCDSRLADINSDGAADAFDIDPFVDILTGR